MSLSFNEIEAIALKAARGAGLSWGLAEEAGFAARWLAEHGLDWSGALLARCGAAEVAAVTLDGPMRLIGAGMCPLRVGAFIADAGIGGEGCEIRDVVVPLLLLPFLARAGAQALGGLDARFLFGADAGSTVHFQDGGLIAAEGAAPLPPRAAVRVSMGTRRADARLAPRVTRPLLVTEARLGALQVFERATYVPASAQSRLAGAGAGLSDND